MKFKNCDIGIKDIDAKQGIVTGYLSVFGNKDSDGDVMVKGAYTRSISHRGPEGTGKIAHMIQHDPNRLVGKFTVLKEDNTGLYFESLLSKATIGKDALIMYEEGIYREHSVGFYVLQDDRKNGDYDEEKGNYIYEAKLIEGSTVWAGANPLALATGVKSQNEIEYDLQGLSDEQIATTLQKITKSLKLGNLSDSSLQALEKVSELITAECQKRFVPPKSTQSEVTAEIFFSELAKRLENARSN